MNEIQQYRQDSAKWMGYEYRIDKIPFYESDGSVSYNSSPNWHPDESYEQMHMMWNKLNNKEVCNIHCNVCNGTLIEIAQIKPWVELGEGWDKDIRIAFMKAWTEYYKAISHE